MALGAIGALTPTDAQGAVGALTPTQLPAVWNSIGAYGYSGYNHIGAYDADYTAPTGTEYTQSVAGGLTPAGAIARQTQKVMAGILTPSGAITRQLTLGRTVTGSLTPSGSVAKKTMKVLAGAFTPSAGITKKTEKALSGSMGSAGGMTKETKKVVSGSVTPTGTWSFGFIYSQVVSGALTPAGALSALWQAFIPTVINSYRRLTSAIGGLRHGSRTRRKTS